MVRFSYPVPPLRTRMESQHWSSVRNATESVCPWERCERCGGGESGDEGRGGSVRMAPVLVPIRSW